MAEVLKTLGLFDGMKEAARVLTLPLEAQAHAEYTNPQQNEVRIEINNRIDLAFRGNPLRFRVYSDVRDENVPKGLTKKDAIPAEQAKAKTQELLKALGIDEDLSECVPQYSESADHPLKNTRWQVNKKRTYRGFPTYSSVVCCVSAYSGAIRAFGNTPFVAPETVEVRLSLDEASAVVDAFARERGISVTNSRQAFLIIAPPNSRWAGPDEPTAPPDLMHPRLAYSITVQIGGVPYQLGQPFSLIEFLVDAATGKVIGGYR